MGWSGRRNPGADESRHCREPGLVVNLRVVDGPARKDLHHELDHLDRGGQEGQSAALGRDGEMLQGYPGLNRHISLRLECLQGTRAGAALAQAPSRWNEWNGLGFSARRRSRAGNPLRLGGPILHPLVGAEMCASIAASIAK